MTETDEIKGVAKVWYDPTVGFRVYSPEGIELTPACRAKVTIDDNFQAGPTKLATVTIEFICVVVNDKPEPQV